MLIQSRNAHIGSYTEKWVSELLEPLAEDFDAHVGGYQHKRINKNERAFLSMKHVRKNTKMLARLRELLWMTQK